MFGASAHVEAGMLLSYGSNFKDLFVRAAALVDRAQRGANLVGHQRLSIRLVFVRRRDETPESAPSRRAGARLQAVTVAPIRSMTLLQPTGVSA
jgi:hypothetical protein